MLSALIVTVAVTLFIAAICDSFYVIDRPKSMNGGSLVRLKAYVQEIGRERWAKSFLFGIYVGVVNFLTGCGNWLLNQNFFFGVVAAFCIYIAALAPFVILLAWWWKQGTEWAELVRFLPPLVIFFFTALAASYLVSAMLGLGGGSTGEAVLTIVPIVAVGANILLYLVRVLTHESNS